MHRAMLSLLLKKAPEVARAVDVAVDDGKSFSNFTEAQAECLV